MNSYVPFNRSNPGSSSTPFFIERSDDAGTTFAIIGQTAPGATAYQDTTVTDGTSYVYQVDAVSNDLINDNPASSTVTAYTPLISPTALTITPNGATEMDLSWNNNSQTAVGYEVQRSPDGTTWATVGTIDYADTTEFSDNSDSDPTSPPVLATQYYYRVLSTDGDSNYSAGSNVVSSVTAPTISIGSSGVIGGTTEANAGVEGSLVTFVPTVAGATGEADPVSGWLIDWGDGSTPDSSLTHTYDAAGIYTITAITADGTYSGTTDTTISYVAGSLATTDNTDGTYLTGLDYDVTAAFTGVGAEHVSNWLIDWGDGVTHTYAVTDPSTASDTQEFTHTFAGSGYGYSVTISAETSDGVYSADPYVFTESGYSYVGDTIFAGATTPPTGYDFGLTIDDVTSTDETAHHYTIDWGDGSTDSTADVVPGDLSGAIGHNYSETDVYNITVTDSDSSDFGGYETNFSAPSPVVTAATEQVIGAGQSVTLASFSGAAGNAIAYVNWTGVTGANQPATLVPDGEGDGGGTITAAAPSIPGAYAPSVTLYQPGMGNGVGFVEYGGGFSPGVVTVNPTVDVWGVKIDNGENNDLLVASPDGTQNMQTVTVYFPHPAGEALNLTLDTSDDTEDQVWDPTLGTVGTDAALVLGKDSSGTLHSSYDFSVGSNVYYKEFEVGATEGDTTLNALTFTESGSANSGASTSTFNTEASLGEVGATGASGCGGSGDDASDLGIKIIAKTNPNGYTLPTDGHVDGATRNWLVGQYVDLAADVTAPMPVGAKFSWSISGGEAIYSYTSNIVEATQVDVLPTNGPGIGADQSEIRFFWVTPLPQVVPDEDAVILSVHSATGELLTAASTMFNVQEPVSTMSVAAPTGSVQKFNQPDGEVDYGLVQGAGGEGIKILGSVSMPAGFTIGGNWEFIQMIADSSPLTTLEENGVSTTSESNYPGLALDKNYPYGFVDGDFVDRDKRVFAVGDGHFMEDSPLDKAVTGTNAKIQSIMRSESRSQSFRSYLMFQPTGGAWVPVKMVQWNIGWRFKVTGTLANPTLTPVPGSSTGPNVIGPSAVNSEPVYRINVYGYPLKIIR